ncbi:MAG: DUF4143 domain-containing protein, partial [Candidatus Wallbacteria bacterium]|nr:DUF4143 domain-containing protein [Candidatus Wallbacteria bacterium]
LSGFSRFLGLAAALTSCEINYSQLGREAGINPTTAQRWLALLLRTYQWEEAGPYHGNTVKRLCGKPKGHFADTGIACFLQRVSSPEALAVSPLLGSMFESFMFHEIRCQASSMAPSPQFYHWRTAGGAEADLVLEWNGFLFPVEVKCKTHLDGNDLRGLKAFSDTYGRQKVKPALVVYAGKECYLADPNIVAVPWNAVWKRQSG